MGGSTRSLRSRLVVLALASATATLIVGSIAGWITWQEGRRRIDGSLIAASRGIMVAIERELDQAAALGRGISVSNNLRSGDIAAFRTQAAGVVSQYGYVLALKGADGDRELLDSPP